MERENIIELVKTLGITAEELGIKPEIKTITEKDEQLFHEVSEMIHETEMDLELVRNYINEKYWDDLAIVKKKYKIVRCEMEKMIYKKIYVAIPNDEDIDNVSSYMGFIETDLDTDHPDDEENWEIYNREVEKDNLTEEEVKEINNKGEDEIWNYYDFAE